VIRLFRLLGYALGVFVKALTGATSTPTITRVNPMRGWPGSILTIEGFGFDDTLDGNAVDIGGDAALVMEASPKLLKVVTGENTKSGLIRVTARGITAIAPALFDVRPWADERDSASSGPPVFFHGPQNGTPSLLKKDMRVLVVFASGAGSPPVSVPAEIASEMATFDSADLFWRQATYKRTSFKYEVGPWVNLPLPRNAYVYDDLDIEWARADFLTQTKRWTQIAASRAYCAHQGGGLTVADVAGTSWPSELARLSPGWIAYHVVIKGNNAFIAAGKDGLVVSNISGSVPVQIAKLTLGGNIHGCDVAGNTLVAAAREGGVEFYEISNPSSPVRQSVLGTGTDWATCVKVVGSRAYVGAGKKIRIYDISNIFVPHVLGEAPLGDWAMGVDVAGNTCVVATDGSGLAIFDVSGLNPSPRGNNKDALHLFSVRIQGNLVYAAAGSDGVLVVDIADPTNPALASLKPTGSACYDVAVSVLLPGEATA
jgi:hypothetical protein